MFRKSRVAFSAAFLIAAAHAAHADAPQTGKPLALEDAVRVASYTGWDISPDGTWLAYTYVSNRDERQRIGLTELATARTIELGGGAQRSTPGRTPPWSPDGSFYAYTSDESGAPALWVWDRTTSTSRKVDVAQVPGLGTEFRWFQDAHRLVLPVVPESSLSGKASTCRASSAEQPSSNEADSSPVAVRIYSAHTDNERASMKVGVSRDCQTQACDASRKGRCDLAIVDVRANTVTRIARDAQFGVFYEPSPDGRHVAYTVLRGKDIATRDSLYELHLIDLNTMRDKVLAAKVPNSAGKYFYWSPDGRFIAYSVLRADHSGEGEPSRRDAAPGDLAVVTISSGRVANFGSALPAALSGRARIVWSADSSRLYVRNISSQLVEVERKSGVARVFKSLSGTISALVMPNEALSLWQPDGPGLVRVATQNAAQATAALYELNLKTDSARLLAEYPQDAAPPVDASAVTGTMVFSRSQPQRPREIMVWARGEPSARPLNTLNAFLKDQPLGEARKLRWRTEVGQELAGALLLPPDYRPGQRVPLVVWLYGGDNGSRYINRFGFWDPPTCNMQVLATRGYAVLFPDAPQRLGQPLKDLVTAVMPGVDAAIAEGFADPERLAIMGHSYGSYSTLALITNTTRFKAAVITAVVHPDLLAQYLYMRGNGNSSEYYFESGQGLIGATPWAAPERYRDNSPIYLFDKIETPLLIGQGDEDPLTALGANGAFVALRRLGKSVEYRLYGGERHMIVKPEHVIDFWQRRLEFLADNLDISLDNEGRVVLDQNRVKGRGSPQRLSSR